MTDHPTPTTSRTTPNPRPPRSSPNSSSTATAPSRTNPTPGRCPTNEPPSEPHWRTSSTPSIATLTDTRLEPDLEDLLWSTVNLFHRAADRIERELDSNEQAQRRSQKEQDGSEVRSVELERLLAVGTDADRAPKRPRGHARRRRGALFETPHRLRAGGRAAGSMVNHRALTAAMIDSRDFLAAKRRAETAVLLPPGPKVASHRRLRVQRPPGDLGSARPGSRQASRHGAAARGIAQGRRADRRLLGRQPQGAAGRLQARLHPAQERGPVSSATTNCSTYCRLGSWCFRARAFPTTWPTRPASSASRCSTTAREAGA